MFLQPYVCIYMYVLCYTHVRNYMYVCFMYIYMYVFICIYYVYTCHVYAYVSGAYMLPTLITCGVYKDIIHLPSSLILFSYLCYNFSILS